MAALAPGSGGGGDTSANAGAGASVDTVTSPEVPPASGGMPSSSPEAVNVVDRAAPAGAAGQPSSGAGGMAEIPPLPEPPLPEPPVIAARCPAGPFPGNPLTGAAAPQAVCTGMTFTEGAVWFEKLNRLFFSDFQESDPGSTFNGRIRSYSPGGACEDFIVAAGTNGLAIAPDGNLLACRHLDRTLSVFDLTTHQPTVLVADNAGAAFNSPNDVAVRSDGNLYFTDPNYQLGNRASEQPTRAYRRDPSGALTVIYQGVNPNGITLSPDEQRLYVSHLGNPAGIELFDLDAAGALSAARPFLGVGSDGMAVDCAGNLYITQGGVRVYDPNGMLLGTLNVRGASNVAFGGRERRTLFITASTSLFAVELAIPGLPN